MSEPTEAEVVKRAIIALLKKELGRWQCPWCFTLYKTRQRFWTGFHPHDCGGRAAIKALDQVRKG